MRQTSTWKAWERRVATLFGGERRGPAVGNGRADSGHNDIAGTEGVFSIEAKHGKSLGYADLLCACEQAETASVFGEVALAVVHREGDKWQNGLVVVRLGHWDEMGLTDVVGNTGGHVRAGSLQDSWRKRRIAIV